MRTVVRTTTIESTPVRQAFRRGVISGEVLALISLCSFMVLSAALVGPRLLRGALPSGAELQTAPREAALQRQQVALHDLLAKAVSVLAVQFARKGEPELDSLVLLISDDRFPGEVNLSEVLVVRFSPLLRSVIAYTWSPDADHDPILSDLDLHTVRRLEELANRPDVVRAVMAQPVVSCEVIGIESAQSARPDASDGPLGLRVTWLDESTDTRDVGMIRTELHLHARSRRF